MSGLASDVSRVLDLVAGGVRDAGVDPLPRRRGACATARGVPFAYPARAAAADRVGAEPASRGELRPRRPLPLEDAGNLQRVALFYEIERSRRQLVDAVRDAVQVGKAPVADAARAGASSTSRSSSRRTTTSCSRTRCRRRQAAARGDLHAGARADDRLPRPHAREPGRLQDPRRHRAPRDAS